MTRVKPSDIEAKAETKYVTVVRGLGAMTRKLNGLGYRSWPDQWTIPPSGIDFMIEFKRSGEGPTTLQADLHADLRRHGKLVYVCDNLADALLIYRHHADGKRTVWKKPRWRP